jgi:hypothetical protein
VLEWQRRSRERVHGTARGGYYRRHGAGYGAPEEAERWAGAYWLLDPSAGGGNGEARLRFGPSDGAMALEALAAVRTERLAHAKLLIQKERTLG